MPSKYYKRNFVKGYYYHIFNRGSRKQNIFFDQEDYRNFLNIVKYYFKFPTGKPLSLISEFNLELPKNDIEKVENSFEISAFCLIPNHFHLLLKQIKKPETNNSIINFMRRLSITYAMYFQEKHDLSGSIFQGKYKNIIVKTDEQLLHLTKYIHTNPLELLNPKQDLSEYVHSSYRHYISIDSLQYINAKPILNYFSKTNPKLAYKLFIEDGQTTSKSISKLLLE